MSLEADPVPVAGAKKLKDWFDRQLLSDLGGRFASLWAPFPVQRFVELAGRDLEQLEMMDRVRQIADAMAATFPGPTAENMRLLVSSMDAPLPHDDSGQGMVATGFHLWPYGEYIGGTGLDDWDASWNAMLELTQRLSSEFAIRPFLTADLEQSLDRLAPLTLHSSHHVRRWVSEGLRTRLPWARAVPALKQALSRRLEMLEKLKDDPSIYVRRSVANHLQDILKDDQESGLAVLERWAALGQPEVDWVVRHAARGLLKAGHPRVLALYGQDSAMELVSFAVGPEALRLGQSASLRAELRNPHPGPEEVRVDYLWEGPTPSGRRFSKVFRWTDLRLEGAAGVELSRSHPFLERSTRKLPPGDYRFALLVNGRTLGEQSLRLNS